MNKSPVETIPSPVYPSHGHPVTNHSPSNDKVLYPLSTRDIHTQGPIDSSTREESSISSDTLSLHDSLDSLNEERSCAEGQTYIQALNETPKETCTLLESHMHSLNQKSTKEDDTHSKQDVTPLPHDIKQNQVETSFQKLKIQSNPTILGWESPSQSTLSYVSTRKGILKKHSDSDISSNSSLSSNTMDDKMSKQSNAKHVRFLEDINEQDTHSDDLELSTSSSFTPKMKISLTNRGGAFPQHVISSSVRRLSERSSKNGITIHIPQAMYNQQVRPKNGISTQLITLPVDKTVMELNKIPTDDEISVLWSQISSYFHHKGVDSSEHFNNLPNSSKPVRHKRCQNTSQQHIKLWKRQQQIPQPVISGYTNNSGLY